LEPLLPQPLLAPEGDDPPNLIDFIFPDHEPVDVLPNPPPPAPDPIPLADPRLVNPNPVIQTRSGRIVRCPNRLIETMSSPQSLNIISNPRHSVRASIYNRQFLMALNCSNLVESLRSVDHAATMSLVNLHTDIEHNTIEWMHPMVLAAKANAEDNPTWEQAMNGPDRDGYLEAARKEIKTLSEDKDAWEVVDRQEWMKILPSTWAFKCKRFPDGRI
jgi:hypothetical protein